MALKITVRQKNLFSSTASRQFVDHNVWICMCAELCYGKAPEYVSKMFQLYSTQLCRHSYRKEHTWLVKSLCVYNGPRKHYNKLTRNVRDIPFSLQSIRFIPAFSVLYWTPPFITLASLSYIKSKFFFLLLYGNKSIWAISLKCQSERKTKKIRKNFYGNVAWQCN